MGDHRVELHVSFYVSDEEARQTAENVLETFQAVGKALSLGSGAHNFSVTPSTVDGNGWYEKWDQRPSCRRCGGRRKVPDWSNWNEEYREPRPKPCPDCVE